MHTKIREIPVSIFVSDDTENSKQLRITFDGKHFDVPEGVTVASALLLSGIRSFRSTPVSESPRAPYCMMGVCFECLVEIDGRPSRQSCLIQVRDGMVIKRQNGASELNIPSAEG